MTFLLESRGPLNVILNIGNLELKEAKILTFKGAFGLCSFLLLILLTRDKCWSLVYFDCSVSFQAFFTLISTLNTSSQSDKARSTQRLNLRWMLPSEEAEPETTQLDVSLLKLKTSPSFIVSTFFLKRADTSFTCAYFAEIE